MSHFIEGLLVGILGGAMGGFLLARRTYNKAATAVAQYILKGRENAIHPVIR